MDRARAFTAPRSMSGLFLACVGVAFGMALAGYTFSLMFRAYLQYTKRVKEGAGPIQPVPGEITALHLLLCLCSGLHLIMFSLIKLRRVFTVHQVPKAFQEDGIISGYRHPRSSATDCVLSLFQLTNETLNVWTHFLPTWYFLWKLMTVLLMEDAWHEPFTWPLLVYLFCCCVYPLASSCAHTFSSMSTRARHICYFFDYGALSLYSLGSAISYSAYIFPDVWLNGAFHSYYIPTAVINTILSTSLACYSRLGLPLLGYNYSINQRFSEKQSLKLSKVLRILAFAYPYLFDNIPLFYRLFLCEGDGCAFNEANTLHVQHILLAFLTGFLFATHLPERLAPGRFDYIGHSHQLFHVCAIIATHVQMKAVETDMMLRKTQLLLHAPAITFNNTLGAALVCVCICLLIICVFSLPLIQRPTPSTAANSDGEKHD